MSEQPRATHLTRLAAIASFLLISLIAATVASRLPGVQASNVEPVPGEPAFRPDNSLAVLMATATPIPGKPAPPAGGRSLIIEESSAELVGDSIRLLKEPIAPPVGVQGWTTLMTEGFEGSFPGTKWTLQGNPTWGRKGYRPHSGSWSGYCAGGGSGAVNPPGPYPNSMNAWMIYGPFDLSTAYDAELLFYYWLKSEEGYDYFKYYASTDGSHFYGWITSGDTNGWASGKLELDCVPVLGDVTGDSSVWIAFKFDSDSSTAYEGAYVDDVVLRAFVEAATPTPTLTVPPTGGDIYGQVTYNGGRAPDGIELELWFYNGSSWLTGFTTTTSGGAYHFRNTPSLSPGQRYCVLYRNIAGTSGYLWAWWCDDITSYSAGSSVRGGDFDIADVPLGPPDSTDPQPLPLTFNWTIRSTVPSDTYEFHMWDPDSGAEYFSGDLGHVNSYTLDSPPDGFTVGKPHSWDVYVYGPYGAGLSYQTHAVKFSAAYQVYLPLLFKYLATPPPPVLLCNGDFESGSFPPCWTFDGQLPTSIVSGHAPHGGDYAALFGDPELGSGSEPNLPVGSGWIEQEFTVPSTGSPGLSFWYRIYTYDKAYSVTEEEFYDTLVVTIRGDVVFRDGYCWHQGAVNEGECRGWTHDLRDLGWQQGRIDLRPYQGQKVKIRFANWSDESLFKKKGNNGKGAYNTWTYLDDVVVTD
jgi:hypothetical protein